MQYIGVILVELFPFFSKEREKLLKLEKKNPTPACPDEFLLFLLPFSILAGNHSPLNSYTEKFRNNIQISYIIRFNYVKRGRGTSICSF